MQLTHRPWLQIPLIALFFTVQTACEKSATTEPREHKVGYIVSTLEGNAEHTKKQDLTQLKKDLYELLRCNTDQCQQSLTSVPTEDESKTSHPSVRLKSSSGHTITVTPLTSEQEAIRKLQSGDLGGVINLENWKDAGDFVRKNPAYSLRPSSRFSWIYVSSNIDIGAAIDTSHATLKPLFYGQLKKEESKTRGELIPLEGLQGFTTSIEKSEAILTLTKALKSAPSLKGVSSQLFVEPEGEFQSRSKSYDADNRPYLRVSREKPNTSWANLLYTSYKIRQPLVVSKNLIEVIK